MIRLFDVPHAEARRVVATGAPVYLTVNPVEYHGPHLSLHNDRLVSLGLVAALHARLQRRHPQWPLVVADDLEIGVEPCPGVGSRWTPFTLGRQLVVEACRALAELGCARVVLMTFHGAPLHNHVLESGVAALAEAGVPAVSPFNLVLRQMLTLRDPAPFAEAFAHIDDADERARMMRELPLDFHAGFFETSMALHYAPDSVGDYQSLPPCPTVRPDPRWAWAARLARAVGKQALADELGFAAAGYGWFALAPFPGYTGAPHRATAAAGAVFARHILDLYEPLVEEVLAGRARSPEPIMQWVRSASLGGRVGSARP